MRRFELLEAVVAARLLEDVDRGLGGLAHGRECRFRPHGKRDRPRRSRRRRDLKRFIEFPFRLHREHPLWVPPLKLERRLFLNRRMNAFFSHGEAEYFLAHRDGRVVGRISAQVNHAFNEYQEKSWGWFGFLEFERRPGGRCEALLDAAAAWLRERGHGADGRPDELRDERRERDPDRGLRPAADDPAALAPALLPAS